jgi:plastocyanin
MRTSLPFRLPCISDPGRALRLAPLALLASGAPVEPATVRGQVEFRAPLPVTDYEPNVYGYLPPSTAARAPQPWTAVVYLEDIEGNLAAAAGRRPAAIDQQRETFIPHLLAVQVGTRVEFPNSDSTFHNVFSLSKSKRFDLGRYPKGESRSVVFDRKGLVRVFCEIHSHMSALVLVLPHPYFDTTDASGRYAIPNVPPGRYQLVAWNDRLRKKTREIEVAEADLQIDFVLDELR